MDITTQPSQHHFDDRQACADTLALVIADKLRQGVRTNGRATLVVSGGSTPITLFSALSAQSLPWQKIAITLADERWVAPSSPDSNEALVKQYLLKGGAQQAVFCSLYRDVGSPELAVDEVENDLKTLSSPFDVIVLGMGNDGHTASLFPCCKELKEGLATSKLCLATHPKNGTHARLSLSLSALMNSQNIYLLLSGKEKQQVLADALAGSEPLEKPIRAVLQQHNAPVDVYWSEN